jgi:hypothetical protein
MIVPFIDGWIEQWYVYVPGWANVNVYDAPVESESEENAVGEPESETMVCGAESWLVHLTTAPVFTVRADGSNAKFLIVIVFPPPFDACGTAGVAGAGLDEQPATMQEMITRAIHAERKTRRECVDIIP